MKKIIIAFFATSIFFISCNNKENKIDSTTSKAENIILDSATMMKNWMDYMTPGEQHNLLAKANGEWETENTMWMSPDAAPTITKGYCINKMIMGGRYQISENKGSFNGMPFEGISTVAYDNAKKVYISTWIDNFGTGIMQMEGTYDSTSKTIHFKGNMIEPMTGKDCSIKENFTMIDDNHQMIEMFAPTPDGKKEYKTMTIKFTRKK